MSNSLINNVINYSFPIPIGRKQGEMLDSNRRGGCPTYNRCPGKAPSRNNIYAETQRGNQS